MADLKLVVRFMLGMVFMGLIMLLLTYYIIKKEEKDNGK